MIEGLEEDFVWSLMRSKMISRLTMRQSKEFSQVDKNATRNMMKSTVGILALRLVQETRTLMT
jgi:hypothetical protein